MPTGQRLVIVESPAKAKTIAGYLGPGYVVESSIGHIRDLPRNAADVPAAYKGKPWARLGVDTDNDFEPLYVISADRKQQVTKLKGLVKDGLAKYRDDYATYYNRCKHPNSPAMRDPNPTVMLIPGLGMIAWRRWLWGARQPA